MERVGRKQQHARFTCYCVGSRERARRDGGGTSGGAVVVCVYIVGEDPNGGLGHGG